jgi:hypothetical protein
MPIGDRADHSGQHSAPTLRADIHVQLAASTLSTLGTIGSTASDVGVHTSCSPPLAAFGSTIRVRRSSVVPRTASAHVV